MSRTLLYGLIAFLSLLQSIAGQAATHWEAGFSKVDVTPKEPVRMSGYGNRDHASVGVDTPLFVRAVCLRSITDKETDKPLILLSIDNIGLSGARTRGLASKIESKLEIGRERVVFCSTHTHSGPDLAGQLSNIFATPLTDEETGAAKRYAAELDQAILNAVDLAFADLKPASLSYGVGNTSFAANRRLLTEGKWTGFGVQADGPVDHSVPVLRISAPDGSVRGLIFNYACHCTTVGGDYYKINADWAGYAATQLESNFDGAVALCTIGCGADANPNPRGTVEFSKMHGQALADEIQRLLATQLAPINTVAQARFDYAALSFELPTREELEERLADSRVQTRRHAQQMIKVLEKKGRLPATYPVPIQSWTFGDQLSIVFIGGEVVVDYALRLKKTLDDADLWVSAYSNDVLGYIASERMRAEGGYEFDRSGIYYGLPGPWASGTEDLLISRIVDLVTGSGRPGPQSPEAALDSIQVPDSFRIELVAAEPLVQDPVNIAFGDDGRLWVVEMGDYPEGDDGGRVKTLTDTDGDGIFDQATTFLSGLPFPTGVQPWNDGVLISAAPDVLFAKDTNGDGKADQVESIYSGFRLANPQHRVNGFTYGLDHSLHLASGDNLGEIKSERTGQTVNASGHDVQIWPDDGGLAVTNGRTQFVRSRDSYGRWFGNNNSLPMFHFPIDDRFLKRNPAVSFSSNAQQLFTPAVAPPVYPLTSSDERFNDLFAANRFTSACSSIIARSPIFDDAGRQSAFICEPVHNLLHRSVLVPLGSSFHAERTASEQASEFLASTDPWFRPVRAVIGPDGMLYVVDMYREVIEHPEWIPDAWQERLDVRAGHQFGRIYRVSPSDSTFKAMKPLGQLATSELVEMLRSPIGPLRDQAQRLILHRKADGVQEGLVSMATGDESHFAKIHALSILDAMGWLENETLEVALRGTNSGVLIVALRLSESRLAGSSDILNRVASLSDHPDPTVALEVALMLGQAGSQAAGDSQSAGDALARIATRPDLDRWLADAVVSSASAHADVIAKEILRRASTDSTFLTPARFTLLQRLLATVEHGGGPIAALVKSSLESSDLDLDTRFRLAECVIGAANRSKSDIASLSKILQPLRNQAAEIARDPQQSESIRCRAVSLISLSAGAGKTDSDLLLSLLNPATPVSVQCKAIDGLSRQGDIAAMEKMIDPWQSLSISVRNHLITQLLSRRKSTELLLRVLESEKIKVNEISLSAREQLVKTGSRSMRVQADRLIKGSGSRERGALVRDYLAQFTSNAKQASSAVSAEQDRGAELFKKHCATCHSTDPSVAAIGASLSNLSNRSDVALVESILNPNRAVEPKYQSYIVQTDEGKTLVGVIESEVADSLTLAHADGKRTTIRRNQIERIKSTGTSLMPEGFETTLNPQQLQSIVRYLQR